MRKIIAVAITAIIITGCGSKTEGEVVQQAQQAVAETTTTAVETTTTTTTTTTTVPGPRWQWDESFIYNMDYLVGAPIDPDFADDIDDYESFMSANGYSVRERYWANYITAGNVACGSLDALYDMGVEANWNRWEASEMVDFWIEESIKEIQTMPGFSGLSRDEAMSIQAAGIAQEGCYSVYEFFYDFIEG